MEQSRSTYWDNVPIGRGYQRFMDEEGIPVHRAMAGVDDVTELPRRPWARTGGLGTFILMMGAMQAQRSVYVAEIPGGGALEPERHLYDEALFILQGRGFAEVWQEGGPKVTFEWGEGSLFAPPMNAWHRLVNGSRQPALVLGFTTAPWMMNAVHNTDFIFNCDYRFADRFGGQPDYFTPGEERFRFGAYANQSIWETNFIPDARAMFLDDFEQKVAGGQLTGYRMGVCFPNGHISEWPVGVYHKSHFHGQGGVLLGLRGTGYVLVWPNELGRHPYQDGHAEQVVTINWGPRSVYSAPVGWYHQHFNTSGEPARHIAVYGQPDRPETRPRMFPRGEEIPLLVSDREGGDLIEYEDEDPEIRRRFEEELRREGIQCTMPPVTYRG